jgi:hypothetical protein
MVKGMSKGALLAAKLIWSLVGTLRPAEAVEVSTAVAVSTESDLVAAIGINSHLNVTIDLENSLALTQQVTVSNVTNLVLFGHDFTLDAGGRVRCFLIEDFSDVAMHNLVIAGGFAASYGGGILLSRSTLALEACTLTGNAALVNTGAAGGAGGAIFVSEGSLVMLSSTISFNEAQIDGAGVFLTSGSNASVKGCTLASNAAGAAGGAVAVFAGSSVAFTACAFSNNSAAGGSDAARDDDSALGVTSACSAGSFDPGQGVLGCEGCGNEAYPADLLNTACSPCADGLDSGDGALACEPEVDRAPGS